MDSIQRYADKGENCSGYFHCAALLHFCVLRSRGSVEFDLTNEKSRKQGKMADDEARMAAGVKARASQVRALLAQRKNEEAVRVALEDPPIQSKADALKDENAQTVMTALAACNKGETQRAIDALSPELEDNLMKYLARFLGLPSQSAIILDWHQKLAAKAGAGCIMRAFTERKQV
jgi:hypothetical protein